MSLSLLAVNATTAQTITLVNPSFELSSGYNGGSTSTIPGWDAQTTTFGQVTDVSAQFTSGLSGVNAIWINNSISQLTTETFTPGVTYTMTVDIGIPLNFTDPNTSGIGFGFRNAANTALISGTGQIFVTSDAINAIPAGTFQTFTLSYTAVAEDAGNPIRIGINDFFSTETYRLDNVTLTAVPEPSVYAFLGIAVAALAFLRSRRARRA